MNRSDCRLRAAPNHRRPNGTTRPCDPRGSRGPPAAFHRLHQFCARARPLRDADFPDRGDRPRGGLRPSLRRTAGDRHGVVLRLRHLLAAGGMARRPLEPAQHDGGVLRRHRAELRGRRFRAQLHRAGGSPVLARPIRGDLPSRRHRDRRGGGGQSWAHARVQRCVRQSRRGVCRGHHRGADGLDRLALRLFSCRRWFASSRGLPIWR